MSSLSGRTLNCTSYRCVHSSLYYGNRLLSSLVEGDLPFLLKGAFTGCGLTGCGVLSSGVGDSTSLHLKHILLDATQTIINIFDTLCFLVNGDKRFGFARNICSGLMVVLYDLPDLISLDLNSSTFSTE